MKEVAVRLPGGRDYEVAVGHGAIDALGERCRRLDLGGSCALVGDAALAETFVDRARRSLSEAGFEVLVLPYAGGEAGKNLASVEELASGLSAAGLDRGAWVAAAGGGVVGDLAGFVAATYLRGVDVVQVPTTIVAQVDASIGGKTGVNLRQGKNLVGAFHQPRLVLADTEVLRALPREEVLAGLAEVVKHGVIRDEELFALLERSLEEVIEMRVGAEELDDLIARNVRIKAGVVAADEREGGLRAILNYGHTLGHAIEAASDYGFRHGEAVLLGMAAAAEIADRLGLWESAAARARHDALVERLGLRPGIGGIDAGRIFARTRADKKRASGRNRFILARGIGRVEVVDGVDDGVVREAISFLQRRYP